MYVTGRTYRSFSLGPPESVCEWLRRYADAPFMRSVLHAHSDGHEYLFVYVLALIVGSIYHEINQHPTESVHKSQIYIFL